ncbi:MAG: hypothetical protein ACPG49_01985 [Chitinophagales bacterium]
MKIFAIVTLIISTLALAISVRSFFILQKMGMLNREYLKHKGLKNTFAYLTWILVWLGAVGLLKQELWGKSLMQYGLIFFLIWVLMTGITRIIALVQMGWVKVVNDEDDDEQETDAEDEGGFWDEGLKNYIFKDIAVNLVMMTLFSGLVIWALLFLQGFTFH